MGHKWAFNSLVGHVRFAVNRDSIDCRVRQVIEQRLVPSSGFVRCLSASRFLPILTRLDKDFSSLPLAQLVLEARPHARTTFFPSFPPRHPAAWRQFLLTPIGIYKTDRSGA